MNKLIKSSLFNISTAREQRRQARWLGENSSPRDVRRSDNDWGQEANRFPLTARIGPFQSAYP